MVAGKEMYEASSQSGEHRLGISSTYRTEKSFILLQTNRGTSGHQAKRSLTDFFLSILKWYLYHLEVTHHRHVLMFQVVAVENISAPVSVELDQDARCLAGKHIDGILPARFVDSRTASMAQYLKVRQVKMQGVVHIGAKLPYFCGSKLWTGVHPLRIESPAIDSPTLFPSPVGEVEQASCDGILDIQAFQVGQPVGD